MLAKNIREQILKRLKEKNLSILALEGKAGLNKGISNIMLSRSVNPKIETVYAIAEALGCTINDLIISSDDAQIQKKQEDCEFTAVLFQEIVQKTIEYIQIKKMKFTLSQVISIIKEAYIYFFIKKNKVVDPSVIEWLVDKNSN